MEQKLNRPYAQVVIKTRGLQFAIPLRSNITHPHAYWTDKKNKCGVDFSKAVVITDPLIELDNLTKVFLRQSEFDKLKGKEYRITKMMETYIEIYRKAKLNQDNGINKKICKFSTLQYFEGIVFTNGFNNKNTEQKIDEYKNSELKSTNIFLNNNNNNGFSF